MFAKLKSRISGRPNNKVAVPNTANLQTAATAYFTAARNAGVNKANISSVNSAIKKLASNAYPAAAAPAIQQTPEEALVAPEAPQTGNYGLAKSYASLTNAINKLNTNAMKNLSNQVKGAVKAIEESGGNVGPNKAKIQSSINKANALSKATGGLIQAVKSFLTLTVNSAKKNNANYVNRLNLAFKQLGNLKPVFQANYNKAKANATKTVNTVVKQAIPMTKRVGTMNYFINPVNMKEGNLSVGTIIYKLANNGNGYVQGSVKKAYGGFGGAYGNFKRGNATKWNYNNNKGFTQRAV